jgi:hypothetical protein
VEGGEWVGGEIGGMLAVGCVRQRRRGAGIVVGVGECHSSIVRIVFP